MPSSNEFCSSDHDAGTHFWNGDCDPVYVNGFKALGPPSNKRMVYSPDGTRIAAATYNGGLKILDSASREVAGGLMAHLPESGGRYVGYESDHTKALCYSPDGELIATGSGIGQIRIWRTSDVEEQNGRTGAKCLKEFWAQKESINDLCFSEDGSHLISSSDDKTIVIWSLQSERQVGRLVGHTLWISSMIVCGDYVVSAGPKSYNKPERRLIGGDLFVWNWKTKRAIIRIEEEHYVSSLASSPKGDRFAAGGSDGLLRIWSFKDLFEFVSATN